MSYSADGIKRPSQLVPESEEPICIVVGAIAKVSQYYQSWPLIQLLSVIIPGRHRDWLHRGKHFHQQLPPLRGALLLQALWRLRAGLGRDLAGAVDSDHSDHEQSDWPV